jgi:hypothetical protein
VLVKPVCCLFCKRSKLTFLPDAEWIESMNTVMDDNKMLTLASNERIPLTPTMRLLLEINHMNHCSPATVSRGGVIFVNADDVGWKPGVDSWIEKLEAAEYRPLLTTLFSRYVDPCLEHCRRNFKTVVPIPAVSQVCCISPTFWTSRVSCSCSRINCLLCLWVYYCCQNIRTYNSGSQPPHPWAIRRSVPDPYGP